MTPLSDGQEQAQRWTGVFGKEYTERNPHTPEQVNQLYSERFGMTRTAMNQEFIGTLSRDIRILEAGCNVGSQLVTLQQMGFKNLYWIDLQDFAVELAKKNCRNIYMVRGNLLDIPFKDNYFDMVFTSGVLIHINPANLPKAMKEIARCSKKYIFGLEYFSQTRQEINYRGNKNLAWKCDFAAEYIKNVPGLKLVKEKRFSYLQEPHLMDTMYLLEKT